MAKARTRTMVRYVSRPRRASRRSGMTVPVAVLAGFAPLAGMVIHGIKTGGLEYGLQELSTYTTGYIPQENRWSFPHLAKGMAPVLAGVLVHKLAGRFGVNRALASAGVPFLRF